MKAKNKLTSQEVTKKSTVSSPILKSLNEGIREDKFITSTKDAKIFENAILHTKHPSAKLKEAYKKHSKNL